MMHKPRRDGLQRFYWAFIYSRKGVKAAWEHEAAFRQELTAMLILVPLAFFLGETAEQRILLIAPCFFVIITELLNSAIEAVVDRIGSEHHALSGQAKDMASAAVLLSIGVVFISWTLIIWQRFVS